MANLWSGALDWLAVAVAVLGAVGFLLGRRGWRSETPVCGKCFHAIATINRGADPSSARCPECGHALGSPGGTRRSIPSVTLKSFGLLLVAFGIGFWLWNGAGRGIAKLVLPRYQVKETHTIHGLAVVVSRPRWVDDNAFPLVEVRQSGRVVFASTMTHPSVGSARLRDPFCDEPVPVLWIRSDSGGSLGLSETFVFRVGASDDGEPDFLPHSVLHEGSFVKSDPEQPEPDVWIAYDLNYAYWLTTGASSPSVALRGTPTASGVVWRDPDPADAPDPARLEAVRTKLRSLAESREQEALAGSGADQALGLVLDAFLELVYAGRASEAWSFLRACYADGLGALTVESPRAEVPRSLDALERILLEQMQRSRFIDEVLRRNRGSIAPPAPALETAPESPTAATSG